MKGSFCNPLRPSISAALLPFVFRPCFNPPPVTRHPPRRPPYRPACPPGFTLNVDCVDGDCETACVRDLPLGLPGFVPNDLVPLTYGCTNQGDGKLVIPPFRGVHGGAVQATWCCQTSASTKSCGPRITVLPPYDE